MRSRLRRARASSASSRRMLLRAEKLLDGADRVALVALRAQDGNVAVGEARVGDDTTAVGEERVHDPTGNLEGLRRRAAQRERRGRNDRLVIPDDERSVA